MKMTVKIIAFGVLVFISHSIGQIIGDGSIHNLGHYTGVTNNFTSAEAAAVASHLHVGMTKNEVVSLLETNNIKGWADILNQPGGGKYNQTNGWKSAYYLSNGCLLSFDYTGAFDTNGKLCGALVRSYITTSNEETFVSIPLTNAP
jgi:hypothetical protein